MRAEGNSCSDYINKIINQLAEDQAPLHEKEHFRPDLRKLIILCTQRAVHGQQVTADQRGKNHKMFSINGKRGTGNNITHFDVHRKASA